MGHIQKTLNLSNDADSITIAMKFFQLYFFFLEGDEHFLSFFVLFLQGTFDQFIWELVNFREV